MVKKRFLENKINRLLKSFPVVVILGARQCGKSTLSEMVTENWSYFDLENPNHFQENPSKIIIDEAQKSAALFEVLRGVIDQDRNKKGRFILTGSASFELTKNISESLAGRVGIVTLSSFKMSEFLEEPLSPFFHIFDKKVSDQTIKSLKNLTPTKNVLQIKKYLLKGGYPEPVLNDNIDFHLDWMENYFDTYINRDMRAMYPRIDLIKYRRIVAMLSSLSGTIVNKSDIARSVEVSEKTVRDYMEIISGTFFWRDLKAYTTPKIKTTVKMPKGHYCDSGLALFLQNIHTKEELDIFPGLGRIFESFIVEEIIRGIEYSKARNISFSHFRTKAGGEIDLITEGSFGLIPIEIKHHSNTAKKQITSLINFVDLHQLPLGIVINNAIEPSLITEKIIQIPAGCI